MKAQLFVFVIVTLATIAASQAGECRFDVDLCSCKMGEVNQGLCWDKIAFSNPMTCQPRACKRGWTCACEGRTHLCVVKTFQALSNTGNPLTLAQVLGVEARMLKTESKAQGATNTRTLSEHGMAKKSRFFVESSNSESNTVDFQRTCEAKSVSVAFTPDIELGSVRIGISERGTKANQCTNVRVYINGDLVNRFSNERSMEGKDVAKLVKKRAHHTKLELRPGDVLAFNFKQA